MSLSICVWRSYYLYHAGIPHYTAPHQFHFLISSAAQVSVCPFLKELLLQYLTEQNSTHLFGQIVVYPITLQGHKTWRINNG